MAPVIDPLCNAKGCNAKVRGGVPMCKSHWASVPSELKAAIWRYHRHDQEPSAEYLAAVQATVDHVASIVKIKGYEEHGSYPSPQAAICSVCFKLAWLCPHDWSLRLPSEKWEAFARDMPWPNPKREPTKEVV